jgi:type 2 lantibiotic biosynthesis protein LanM
VPIDAGLARAVDPARVLAAARTVGDRLVETAYRHRDRAGWLGLHCLDDAQWAVQPLGHDLYSGYPGVALFLGQLAALTGEQCFAQLAYEAMAPVPRLVDTLVNEPAGGSLCGAFTSLPGLAYALVHVAADLRAPDLLTPLEPLVAAVAPTVDDDEVLDVVGGCAGGLAAMLAIHQATGLHAALAVARACADRLVATAQPQRQGVAWAGPTAATQPLTGFSHGAAGIGWSLLRFAGLTGESRHAEVGLDAFRYERSLFMPAVGGWPDYRAVAGTSRTMHAWCHGAPGIGLARADSGFTHLPAVAADLGKAIRAAIQAGAGLNLSLCHGDLGNLELLTIAAAESQDRAARAAHALLVFERVGPVCGTPGGTATPGLMAGLAGIGHGLLRLGFPDRVPSILLLQPPREVGWRGPQPRPTPASTRGEVSAEAS